MIDVHLLDVGNLFAAPDAEDRLLLVEQMRDDLSDFDRVAEWVNPAQSFADRS